MSNYHTTAGIVLDVAEIGEADALLTIFTEALGLVRAAAKGVRLEKSKLRLHLGRFHIGEFQFVEGKEYLRVIDARAVAQCFPNAETFAQWEMLNRFAAFFLRMVRGAAPDPPLWDFFSLLFVFFACRHLVEAQLPAAENFLKLRLIYHLGYLSAAELQSAPHALLTEPLSAKIFTQAQKHEKIIARLLEKGIYASQL